MWGGFPAILVNVCGIHARTALNIRTSACVSIVFLPLPSANSIAAFRSLAGATHCGEGALTVARVPFAETGWAAEMRWRDGSRQARMHSRGGARPAVSKLSPSRASQNP
jgi:hypothetical protein